MNLRKITVVAAMLAAFLQTIEAKVFYFDFGTKNSPVMDGFTTVNPSSKYTAEKGYGFLSPKGVRAINRKLPEPLSQDFTIGGKFRVDLPDGKYKVWIMYGDSHHGQRIWPIIKAMKINANGKTIFHYKTTKKEFYKNRYFAHLNADYRKGENIWDKFLNAKFRRHTASINVKGGKILFTFKKVPLNAMAVYPVADSKEVEDELNYLEKRRRRKVLITEVKHVSRNPVPVPTAKEKNRGFIAFSRDWSEFIYPTTHPLRSEVGRPVEIFAALGENQAGSFSLCPLRDLQGVICSIGELKSKTGKVLDKKNVELRVVRYFEKYAGQRGSGEYKYQVVPLILTPNRKVDLEIGVAKQFFVNVQVTENCAPGIYEGFIRISSKSAKPTEYPLKVRILPIKLAPTPIFYGLYHFNYDYYYYRYWTKIWTDTEMEKLVWTNEERDLRFLRDVGFNSMALSDDLRGDVTMGSDGKMKVDFNGRFGKWMNLYTKLGFGPMPWYGFQPYGGHPGGKSRLNSFCKVKAEQFSSEWIDAYTQVIKLVRDEVKKRKWSPIYFYVSDELGNCGIKGAEHGVKLLKIVKTIKGIRYISSLNGPDEKIELPYLDIAMPNHAFPVTKKTLKLARESKCELWLYNMGFNRFSFGLYPWRVGAKGRFQWYHRSSVVNPYDDFDGGMGGDSSYNMTFPSPDGSCGTIKLERMRAGINDRRYLATLEGLIRLRANSKDPQVLKEVQNARSLIANLKKGISVDIRDYFLSKVDAKEAGGSIGKWNSKLCDKYRWKIATQIMKLNK